MTSVLAKLAGDYEIPIGLERGLLNDDVRLEINVEARLLSEVLEAIVKQEPAYRWELRDGVINFAPTKERSPILVALLKLQISHFSTNKELTGFQLRNSILRLPEVNALMLAESVELDRFSDDASSGANFEIASNWRRRSLSGPRWSAPKINTSALACRATASRRVDK